MANFPMSFPVTWDIDNTTYIKNERATLAVHRDSTVMLEGPVKEAALALLDYAINAQDSCIGMELNGALNIDYEHGISISFVGNKKPEFWDDLLAEFNRLKKMRVFW